MNLGAEIRRRRVEKGWTLDQLSERSGVDVGTISALETRGSSRSQYAPAIAKAFEISLDELYGVVTTAYAVTEPAISGLLADLLRAVDDLLPDQQQALLTEAQRQATENREKWGAFQKKFGLPKPMPDREVGKHIKPRPPQRELPIESPNANKTRRQVKK